MGKVADEIYATALNKTLQDIGSPNVGNLDGDEIGSGARRSANKLRVDLIPVRHWATLLRQSLHKSGEHEWEDWAIILCLDALAVFQEGDYDGEKLLAPIPHPWFDLTVDVFVYGGRVYRPWNWLKGQLWSVPLGCAIRHAKAHVLDGELDDRDSGLPHIGHFVCNLIMLATFADTFPDGNDFPKSKYFKVEK